MANMATATRRLARTAQIYRIIASSKTLIPCDDPSRHLPRHFNPSPSIHHISSHTSKVQNLKTVPEDVAGLFTIPTILAGLFGAGLLNVAHADGDKGPVEAPLPSETPSLEVLEEIAKKDRDRLEKLLQSKGMQYGSSCPRFIVAVKGQKITIKFQIPPTCEVPLLIANLVSSLGLKVEEHGAGFDMKLRACDSAVAWQLTLSPPLSGNKIGNDKGQREDASANEGDLCILLFRSLISLDKPEIEFIKRGSFSSKELDALASALQLAGQTLGRRSTSTGGNASQKSSTEKSVASLEAMGVIIYGLNEAKYDHSSSEVSWGNIVGYHQQKRDIEDTILLALRCPEVYNDIARGTRNKFETNRPRAVLFEGPPGTGKTSCARVIADQAGVPLLYVPLEVLLSKYYGESERSLGKVFSLANDIPNGAIIFLDEVDSFATSRDNEMHEATRRMLSVILRQIDGFEQDKKVVVIAATNRKQDLDPAFLSRFDSMIDFGLPDEQTRQEIVAQYAKQLTKTDIIEFSKLTEGFSGRDIKDVCQQAERRWASKIIRGQVSKDGENWQLPPIEEYVEGAVDRQRAVGAVTGQSEPFIIGRGREEEQDDVKGDTV
ncbi:uncharacterized protein LOC124915551 isoform X2 [Impatiens glandulifera]|uniref:uncharacterized protein LOC124915551 isoform X2 n=1 Tax=Impatiens glandulifera TaxID=253017 RepID=UPI001FB15961|nr:uncharacterized protein LOC124915551 isoform X2 [Impatiens glandulifera]